MLQASQPVVEDLAEDVGSLWCSPHTILLEEPPSAFLFLRDFVSASRPCIIRCNDLPKSLTLDDIVKDTNDLPLVVDVSPDGHADVIRSVRRNGRREMFFVQPEVRRMSAGQFRTMLRRRRQHRCSPVEKKHRNPDILSRTFPLAGCLDESTHHDESGADCEEEVVYYSRQNDCLRNELPGLWAKGMFPSSFAWAEQAFGTGPPQAVNLWIGNEQATSSMHKDHYENLFCVLSGEKIFTLCPPVDAPFLYERDYPSGRFHYSRATQQWTVVPHQPSDGAPKTRWIEANVVQKNDPQHLQSFPLLRYAHPVEIKVPAGCMLYLPALWFHSVTQSCETVAINYWYDMKFESPMWSYFHFMQQLEYVEK